MFGNYSVDVGGTQQCETTQRMRHVNKKVIDGEN